MEPTKNVFITGDKSSFLSKSALKRFKKDIKDSTDVNTLDSGKYFNSNFKFNCTVKDNDYHIEIVTSELFEKEQRRLMLKSRLNQIKNSRSGQPKKQLNSIKRTVPDKVFKAYHNIIKSYNFNIPPPNEVINDIEKHRMQISMINGTNQKVSNDTKANNAVKKYFKILGDFLGIEPMNINIPTQPPENNIASTIDENSDTEDEEAPGLV